MTRHLCLLSLVFLFGCSDDHTADAPEKTEEEIWDELCAATTIEQYEGEGPSTAIIPKDLYCSHFDCHSTLESFVEHFSTCDQTESEWPICAWERGQGCGTVQFEAPCDESCRHRFAFDEATGALLGFFASSDTSLNICGAAYLQVGTFNDYFSRSECSDVEETYCCETQG